MDNKLFLLKYSSRLTLDYSNNAIYQVKEGSRINVYDL